jgi:hypothetical protein
VNAEHREQPALKVWIGVAAAALVGAALIPSGPPGVGFVIAGAAIAGAVGAARPRALDLESGAFAGAALLLLSMAAVYDAPWVIAVDVAAAACCSAFAITGLRRWTTVIAAPLCAAGDAFRVPRAVISALPRGHSAPWLRPAGRALFASAVLLVTFGALFSSADAAFAHIAEEVVFPDVGLDVLPARVFVAVLIAGGAGGLILVAERREADAATEEGRGMRVTTLEWALPLLLLNGLFAAFVLVQLAVLFGGHEHVLETTGLTYAQYARAGFFQLVLIAALVLGVIALAVKVARPPHERLLKALLGVLCVLTLVVLVSALRRMNLYEEAYGLTRIRISVYAVDLWLAGVFAAVMVAGATAKASWLPRAVIGLSVVSLLLFNLANPDGRIARSAVERWERIGEIDEGYVATLSTDALPALDGLPADVRACVAGPIVDRAQHAPRPWSSFNLSRHRALGDPALEENRCSF